MFKVADLKGRRMTLGYSAMRNIDKTMRAQLATAHLNAINRLPSHSRGVSASLPVWTVAGLAGALIIVALASTLVLSLRDRAADRPARSRHARA